MLLSRSAEYGLRAALYLASLEQSGFVSIRDISDHLGLSFHFLTKIFQKLTRAGLLHSYRGPNGGVVLAKPASEITLKDVVVAVDGEELFTSCILGLPGCGDPAPCPLHHRWEVERRRLGDMLEGLTLHDTAAGVRARTLRLTGVG